MNIEKILAEYDAMFGRSSLAEIEEYLVRNLQSARQQSEAGVEIVLLNEIIGFCRDTTQRDKALTYCEELLEIMGTLVWKDTTEYATSLLNIANAYRAFGRLSDSLDFYKKVLAIYQVKLPENDFNFASLYNNWSLLYQEMGDYENAKEMLLRALKIVDAYASALIPQATTRTNLAVTLIQIGTEESYKEAMEYLKVALDIFEGDGGKDFHYGAALAAMGDACVFRGNYEEAVAYYGSGLKELEKHVGRNDNYNRVLEKYNYARRLWETDDSSKENTCSSKENTCSFQKTAGSFSETEKEWISNLDRSRAFYEQYGKEMIHTHFPDYEDRIAAGLVGEGSDCFGFDDGISADHDYAPGFCMWLTGEDYEKIGEALQKEYNNLFMNCIKKTDNNSSDNRFLARRRGVFSINEFYNGLLGVTYDFERECGSHTTDTTKEACHNFQNSFWSGCEGIKESDLATVTNGEVFQDFLGVFTSVREKLLSHYPENLWRRELAQGLHEFSQFAQSNYPRMMARKDTVTARLCIAKAMEAAMDLVYLLEKTYAPYYKWKRKGLEGLELGRRVLPLIEKLAGCSGQMSAWEAVTYNAAEVNHRDACVVILEEIAGILLAELKRQGLVRGETLFLEFYVNQIVKGEEAEMTDDTNRMKTIEKIIDLEWKQFDKVKNEGGRADCQDDFNTFSIMRKSQYLAWTDTLLDSYCNDLQAAESRGWNLIMEKYARMMESTAPERYEQLKKDLPVLSHDRITIQEEIIKIQVAWMEAFAREYPKMAGNSRSIHTYEDNAFNTSYETYLRGEMGTYSETTFVLYGRFIADLTMKQRNLAYEIMENTAKLYGYNSLEDAENKL